MLTWPRLLRNYYSIAHWTREADAYIKQHGLDFECIIWHAGIIAVVPCTFTDGGTFCFDPQGEPAVVIEALAEDKSTIDLVAWPLSQPEAFATAVGAADAVGISNVTNPATWAFSRVLKVHRRPLDWLKDGCGGVCVLDHRHVACWLGKALGPILAEDIEHGQNLAEMLNQRFDDRRILVPAP